MYDVRLLDALQQDARLTAQELAQRVHLSASQCNRRYHRLQQAGVIDACVALLDRERVGFGVMTFVSLSLERQGHNPAERFHEAAAGMAQVLECWAVTGDSDYVMKVVARDLSTFNRFLMDDLLALKLVTAVRTSILLQAVKHTTALPLSGSHG